jgi:hypothetical protein
LLCHYAYRLIDWLQEVRRYPASLGLRTAHEQSCLLQYLAKFFML